MVFLQAMRSIYNLLVSVAAFVLKLLALFSKKMRTFVKGRETVFETLHQQIKSTDKTFWFHCASLGEFEQGVPIMEEMRKRYTDYKIVVSFFSPSGYEIKKNTLLADVVVYLPLDTTSNAKKFIKAVHPSLAFFVKYEFWPNYLFELQKNKIPTYLISGLFRDNQVFFKSYGGFMRKALGTINHFFVQEKQSEDLLKSIGFKNVSISGDTRFDRVARQLEMDNHLSFADEFISDSLCVVYGSSWPEDEALTLNFINTTKEKVKFIIAPHKIEKDKIEQLQKGMSKKTILHSEMKGATLSDYDVLIIDCIGLLGKLYSYADIAFVGGATGTTGLHNILEPATFGVPIIIGKNFQDFPEAVQLEKLKGVYSIKSEYEFNEIMNKLVSNPDFRKATGDIVRNFVSDNIGATAKIMEYIRNQHPELSS